jgi:methyl-accepting chemotaxis protein
MFWFVKRRIRELEAELTALSRSQAMIEFTLDGIIISANENFLHIMGYTAEELVGRPHSIFMPEGERRSTAYQKFWADLARGEFFSASFQRIAKDGRPVWLRASYNPIFDRAGKPISNMRPMSPPRAWPAPRAQAKSKRSAAPRR